MFKRKKKKTGIETPEYSCFTPLRVYKLNHGDVFVLNYVAIKQTFNMPIKDIKLGVTMNENFICTQKIKRRWWQFWKPKYWGAKFMYVEKENTK